MLYRILADLTMALHFAFVFFVVFGGLLVAWRGWVAWLHVPAFLWGSWISLVGWVCPLTPLENRLRRLAGEEGYPGGFLEHYLLGILYPEGMSRGHFVAMGIAVLLLNGVVYAWALRRRSRRRAPGEAGCASSARRQGSPPSSDVRSR